MRRQMSAGGARVMEYREPPRTAAAEGRLDGVIDGPRSPVPHCAASSSSAERQLDLPRVVLVGVSAPGGPFHPRLSGLSRHPAGQSAGCTAAASISSGSGRSARPSPRPPGSAAVPRVPQSRCARAAGETEVLPVLELDGAQLERDFQRISLGRRRRRVEYPPQAITVHLVYKTAGRYLDLRRASRHPGPTRVILPPEDIDTDEARPPLIRITAPGLTPSPENRPRQDLEVRRGRRPPRVKWNVPWPTRPGWPASCSSRSGSSELPRRRSGPEHPVTSTRWHAEPRGLFVQNAEERHHPLGRCSGRGDRREP